MADATQIPQRVRFGAFEVDLRAGELWKSGRKRKLTGQPFSVLAILLERPGEVISREELQRRLWPDTFVDVDHNLNAAINKIREALDDSPEQPRFVETLSRRGYRFIAPIEQINGEAKKPPPQIVQAPSGTQPDAQIHETGVPDRSAHPGTIKPIPVCAGSFASDCFRRTLPGASQRQSGRDCQTWQSGRGSCLAIDSAARNSRVACTFS